MIPQLPMLLAQQTTQEKIEIVQEHTRNSVPPSAIEHAGSYWFPESASTFAPAVDSLYMFIFWVSAIFFAAIVGVMIYFVIKYRRKGKEIVVEASPSHNTMFEILWSVLPSFLLLYMFWAGAEGFFESRIVADGAEEIQVRAFQWNWEFTYPNGDTSTELHLVMNRPTKLIMRSDDVLHSMYIAAFRQKVDVVPGRYTYAYLLPNRLGEYRLACAEYCGDEHSRMRTMCKVHLNDEDRQSSTEWLTDEHPAWENGKRLYMINCAGCHKIDGKAATGPALDQLFVEATRSFINTPDRPVDENYIRDSILIPDKDVVTGFGPTTKMNSFTGKLTDQQIDHLIAYFKTFRDGIPAKETKPADGANDGNAGGGPEEAADANAAEDGANDGAEEKEKPDTQN